MLIKSILDIDNNFSGTVSILEDGTVRIYKNGKLHSENDPAIIGTNGNKVWCINGLWHRENGPAFLSENGDRVGIIKVKSMVKIMILQLIHGKNLLN